ncbi:MULTISPECIES: PP2C family protein-serine/threonine phosphatase [Thermomonosporaceae]|uniref:PP2C family protein-serine/threonine phosphatase n=1 Tax=Thermomonosporaceae TaxID=2012 RepID=UPI00255ABACD|nr:MULTISPECIES: PP2C family protein-serine/threonine phosphatase [Thermomonosporaceae]MDL4775192.1 PP2C family protein-serine/threonine phosphatase [Actinomadura xylanilytica]
MITLAALIGAITAADLVLPDRYTTMALLVAVPTLAALYPSCPPRYALLIGALTLAVATPLAILHREAHPIVAVGSPLGIAATTAMMYISARRQQRSDTAQADLREIAEAMQRALLRPVPERLGPVHARVRYLAAAAQARVGGDLYDVASTPYGVRLIVGDVMGKGLAAVEQATDVLGAYRELVQHEKSLPEVAARLDAFLATRTGEEEFVTALFAEVSADADTVELVTCGHPPPLLLRADGRVGFADMLPPAPPLGLLRMVEGGCAATTLALGPGDRMLIYTDGVSDARNAAGRFYPLAERARALACDDPRELMERLETDLRAYVGGRLHDDTALLLVRFGW